MTEEELLGLPVLVDLLTAATVLGVGRTAAYQMVRTGRWPTPVIRLGNRIRIPTAALHTLISLSTAQAETPAQVGAER